MPYFNIVAETSENTVVTEYEPVKKRSDSYQSEAELEQEFIRMLCEQGYEYLSIHTENDLILNLRNKLEELNDYHFSDTEWQQFFKDNIANPNEHIVEKTRKIQEDNVQVLIRDNGSTKNIMLIDKTNIHNNKLQVINQYKIGMEEGAKHNNRYDVTILVNGFPLIHIELKRRGVKIREAFNQINRYQRESFGAGSGLYEYVQIFVISNGTNTKYYSNSTRQNAQKEQEKRGASRTKTSNSFEFTCFWADANNRVITDLVDFTKTFFAKHTILNILTKYCIFTSENMLMVMRPYQITATERILNRIEIANNYKKYGSIEGGGYIWHTTGSGKTLTSFKTARLATKLPYIDKVLFVVDRKDLDYQTMKEYDRFEKGAANSNTSTRILKRQLEDPNTSIIITTIQKLATFIKKNPDHEVYKEHIVIIFDECHRSQFGDMHTAIVKNFKRYHLFGFTGTPIFSVNSGKAKSTEALIEAGIKKVYVGNLDPNPKVAGGGIKILNDHGIETETGILEEECRQLNDIFFHYIQNDIPYTALKYAMTLDGKIATATGESKWITGEEARRHAHTLRHQYAAIMAGIGTVLADDPMLNARIEHGNDPIRVICDSNLRISEGSNIVKTAREIPTIIATISKDQEKIAKLEQKGCKILKTSEQDGKVNVKEVLKQLRNMEIDSVLVEGGGILNESLIKNNCVHKVYAYIAPKLFGGEKAKTPVEGKGIERIQEALVFDELKATPLGNDILLEGKVRSCLLES